MANDPTPAPVRPESQCQACERPLQACWRFQEGDQCCGLCGTQVLHLIAFPLGPDRRPLLPPPEERDLCRIYWQPGAEPAESPQLVLFWALGTEGRVNQRFLPRIDFALCGARFSGPRRGRSGVHPRKAGEHPAVGLVGRLVPRRSPAGLVQLPAQGAWGELRIVCDHDTIRRQAVLLPPPGAQSSRDLVEAAPALAHSACCTSTSRPRARCGMYLTFPVGVWVMSCRVEHARSKGFPGTLAVEGFEKPVLLEAAKPFEFDLVVDSSGWKSADPVEFQLTWRLLGLPTAEYRGRLALVRGPRLHVDDSSVRVMRDPVQLGQVALFPLPLSVRSGEDGDGPIQLVRCEVHCEGGWLQVVYPTPERLPLVVGQPGEQQAVLLQVDTSRLDRATFNNTRLSGRLELIDKRRVKKTVELEVPVKRPDDLKHWVAFDWGTSNSCAAYSTEVHVRPNPVYLHAQQVKKPEWFPSDVYFKDLSNPEQPVLLIGPDAVDRGEHRECCLHSVKRKFQFHEDVTVVDERGAAPHLPGRGRGASDAVRLVSQAEKLGRFEIRKLGSTFPTKWPPRVRRKLQKVGEQLQQQLGAERHCEVVVRPPEIDEANAVAIDLLTSGETLPAHFHLIAYDFGGGTVDTCVLEVAGADIRSLRTSYVGIGGRRDFGGDEVTRAVLMVLHGRLTAALQPAASGAGGPAS